MAALAGVALVLSVIGAYGPNQAIAEVWVAIAFGFIGFFMRRFGFAPAPLVIGVVLGKLVEETLKQSLIIFDLSWSGFLGRPIALTLFARRASCRARRVCHSAMLSAPISAATNTIAAATPRRCRATNLRAR